MPFTSSFPGGALASAADWPWYRLQSTWHYDKVSCCYNFQLSGAQVHDGEQGFELVKWTWACTLYSKWNVPRHVALPLFVCARVLCPGHPIINDPIYNHSAWEDPAIAGADAETRIRFVRSQTLFLPFPTGSCWLRLIFFAGTLLLCFIIVHLPQQKNFCYRCFHFALWVVLKGYWSVLTLACAKQIVTSDIGWRDRILNEESEEITTSYRPTNYLSSSEHGRHLAL